MRSGCRSRPTGSSRRIRVCQVRELDFAPTFQMGHPLPFELASRLAGMFPGDLNHIFFTNSGSESVDTALKLALAYHRARAEGQRMRFIGRERGDRPAPA